LSDVLTPPSELHGDEPAAAAPKAYIDRKELAATAFERTRMPMVMTDPRQPDNPIVMANQAFLDLSGYTADEVIGRNCRFLQGQGTSPAAVAELRAAVREAREASVEILNYRKDGSPFWSQVHFSPLYDDDGQLAYYFGSQIDVTAYRKVQTLEASEHRLLMEVDHRARNVLSIVNGIVRLSRADNAQLYAASVQQRVQALARAHSLLAAQGWQEASLLDVLRDQVTPFVSDRITLEGPEVMVSPETVQPLALVFHELIVNAATHGALATPAGALDVRWDEAPQYGGFELRWRETGAPPPRRDAPSGFGAIMLSGIVEKQLQGHLAREWCDDGLFLTISIPGQLAPMQARDGQTI
jgi:PAS domain S-box-containing protein